MTDSSATDDRAAGETARDRHDDAPPTETEDSPPTTSGDNAETVPDPDADPDETGREAVAQAERMERHARPVTEPEEPAAPGEGGPDPTR